MGVKTDKPYRYEIIFETITDWNLKYLCEDREQLQYIDIPTGGGPLTLPVGYGPKIVRKRYPKILMRKWNKINSKIVDHIQKWKKFNDLFGAIK